MDSNHWIMAGLELTQHCQYLDAITACRKALLLDPSNNVAWLIIGDALYQLNQYREAVDAYDNVLSFTPKNTDVWVNSRTPSGILASWTMPWMPVIRRCQ